LEKQVSKKFNGGTISPEEMNAELLSIIFELDYVEFSDQSDAIIGKKILTIDASAESSAYDLRPIHDIETAIHEVNAKVDGVDSDISAEASMRICTIGGVKQYD
jgi:hypothetical protein